MFKRSYHDKSDLKHIQDFNATAIVETNHCGYLHPGDISFHIFANKYKDPFESVTIWEDGLGIAAWMLVTPSRKCFDAQVRPDLRGGVLEREVLAFAEKRLVELFYKYGISTEHVYADAFQRDTVRVKLLTDLGWAKVKEEPYVLNRMKIESVEAPVLPKGYAFDTVKGSENAAALAEVHNGAFGSVWTGESYRQFMESPGYDPDRELVIKTPDGRLAAFAIVWFDRLNRTGLFEPVGTHKKHQRMGLGRAIVMHGLQKMAAEGMEYATVAHFGENEAAKGLYQSCGFRPWYLLDNYQKKI